MATPLTVASFASLTVTYVTYSRHAQSELRTALGLSAPGPKDRFVAFAALVLPHVESF